MTTEEFFHVTFGETNHKSIEVEVVDCADILEKTTLKEKVKD